MTGRALLDLNLPAFQDELFTLDAGEYRQVAKTLRKLRAMTWDEIYRDHGLKWETVKSMPGKYTLRLSQQSRAVVRREGDYMVSGAFPHEIQHTGELSFSRRAQPPALASVPRSGPARRNARRAVEPDSSPRACAPGRGQ